MKNQMENSLIGNKELFLYAFIGSFQDLFIMFCPVKTTKKQLEIDKSHNKGFIVIIKG